MQRKSAQPRGPSHSGKRQHAAHQPSMEAKNIFRQTGSLYVLAASQWNKLGKGTLSLIFNPHNARELVFKLKTESDLHIFQLKPKLKPKGGSSWVLKATNTRNNKEDILAVRFNSQTASDLFKQHVDWADKQASMQDDLDMKSDTDSSRPGNGGPSAKGGAVPVPIGAKGGKDHARFESITPSEMRQMLPKQPWDCPLCTFSNTSKSQQCSVCNTPRPLLSRAAGHESTMSPTDHTPMLPTSLQVDHGQISAIFAPPSPNNHDSTFEFQNDNLPAKPSQDSDVSSTLGDFRRILTMIESNITYQDPAKFFTDLRKVAKRLQRPDMKFRCLDLNNPVVKSRLMQVEGVDAYLSYLGFVKDDSTNRLICPANQPPQSVITAAQAACKQFIEQATHNNETMTRIRKFSIQERRRESQRNSTKAKIEVAMRNSGVNGGGGGSGQGLISTMNAAKKNGANAGDTVQIGKGNNKPNGNGNGKGNVNGTGNDNGANGSNRATMNAGLTDSSDSDGKEKERESKSDSDEDGPIGSKTSISMNPHDGGEIFTLKQLVWSVTHEHSRDDKTQEVLLLSHQTFATSYDLFNVLVERFNQPDDLVVDEDEDGNQVAGTLTDEEVARSHWNVQVKVGNMMRHWIKSLYEQDFAENADVVDALYDFFDSMENHRDARVKQLLTKLKKTLEQQQTELDRKIKKRNQSNRRGKDLTNVFGTSKKFKLNDQSAQIIAEQITLMDFKIFKEIQKRECLGQAWKKKDRAQRAPNILAMIDQFNRVSKFVQVLILMAPDIRKRCKVIRQCIKIACHLRELRNFSSLCAFNSALISTPIHRLKDAWNVVPQNDKRKFEEVRAIFAMNDNWKTLRRMHREAHAPAILHTGLFLQDIVAIDEGNENKLKNGKVNFKKLLRLYEKIDTIWMYQQAGYAFKENLLIQKVIKDDFLAQEKLDEDYLFSFSTDVREKDKAKANNRTLWPR